MDPKSQLDPARDRVLAAIGGVVESTRFILGPMVAEAERALADKAGAAHGIGVANGTDALVIALRALGVERGDEVVCPAFTFYATAEAIAAVGATPVFADIEPATFCLDPAAVEAAITPRTRAVVAVDLFGHPFDAPRIAEVCRRHGVALLEDAAQAIGASLGGRACGSLGDAATFSFFPTKNLPCFGDGGLIATDREVVADVCRKLRFHGSRDKQTFELVGYNSRLDALQGAILLELLPLLDGWNDARIGVARRYAELGLGELVTLPPVADGARHVYHLFACRSRNRNAVLRQLGERGVEARAYYETALHLQPVFAHLGYREGSLPETERASREILCLPLFVTLDEQRQREVVDAVRAAQAIAA
jgi:dTDP-4-amino-4,6-dideoxygalactose transaminase